MSAREEWQGAAVLRFVTDALSGAEEWTVVAVPAGETPGDGYALQWRDKVDRETLRRKIGDPFAEDD